ncbi:MAG: ABC transporter permease subunit [Cyanobacteria bacterium SZAS LIN-5]|nr:ABC transporter permease subunit [Cyanobacteria bacterium SZAS LIN-5]RTL43831.1 MAG: ABC transporter permease [Candidatus Melainabacteria bacterium]
MSSSSPHSSALSSITAIGLNTFRETVRDKIMYAFMLFAFVISLLSILLGSLSVGQDVKILEDIGLAAIACISGIIAVFAGTNLVYKELEKRTVYLIFTKPISGWHFIAGKYLGLAACLLIVVAAMGFFLSGLVWMVRPEHGLNDLMAVSNLMMPAVMLVYLELLLVIALATFFSTFASPVMSVLFTLALWLIGHFGDSLKQLGQMSQNPTFAQFSNFLYLILPDLAGLTRARSILMYGRSPGPEVITFITCYVFAYVVLLLVLAAAVTDRREFP